MIELKCNRGDTHAKVCGNGAEVLEETAILIELLLKILEDHVGHRTVAAVLSRVTTDFDSKSGVFGQGVPHE